LEVPLVLFELLEESELLLLLLLLLKLLQVPWREKQGMKC